MASFELYNMRRGNSLEDGILEQNDSSNTAHRQFVEDEQSHTVVETTQVASAEALRDEFEHGVEEEKIWISEHLGRAQCDRPLLGATLQLANITSLSNVVHSHRPRLQHVLDVGRSLLSQPYCHVLPQHPRSSSPADIETKLTQLEATWQELETLVRQQKERLRGVSNANYPTEHQTDDVELDVAASSSEDVVVDVVADDTRAWLRQHCPALLMEGVRRPTVNAMEQYCRERSEQMGLTLEPGSQLTYTRLQQLYLSRRGDVSALKHHKLRCDHQKSTSH